MSRFSKILMVLPAMLVMASCSDKASIEAVIADAPSSEVIVKLLDVNRYQVLDTVRTDDSGRLVYKVAVTDGEPEFVYLFHKDTKIASLLLEAGDKVGVTADTLGNYSVSGSPESVRLSEVERRYASSLVSMNAMAERILAATDTEEAIAARRELSKAYVDYYRESIKYVLNNPYSLTVVPVFYQSFGENLPVFAQSTDAIHFSNAADSLETVYPESKYVKALRAEAERRRNYLELENRLKSAEEIGYPEIELPDINSQKRRLSEVDSEVVIVYFWSAADASQKMFNLDVLKPVYEDFKDKGLEIYQVSLDVDKAVWAKAVKDQKLEWINVCDSRGSDSPYVSTYNIPALPAVFVISGGELVDGKVVDEKSFRALLSSLLK